MVDTPVTVVVNNSNSNNSTATVSVSTDNNTSSKKRGIPKKTAVYVSNLPEDVTIQELIDYFSKCGIIMDEILTGKPRVKLYYVEGHGEESEEPILKGDALIVYLREESVRLALQILDEGELRAGKRIRVQEASFDSSASVDENDGRVGVEVEGVEESAERKKHRIDKETWKKHMRRMNK